jgi:hypothetical protein
MLAYMLLTVNDPNAGAFAMWLTLFVLFENTIQQTNFLGLELLECFFVMTQIFLA